MIERQSNTVDVPLPWLLKGLTSLPWAAKAWIAERHSDGAVCHIQADGVAQYDQGPTASHVTVASWTLDSLPAS
jgi:hypothetical protein